MEKLIQRRNSKILGIARTLTIVFSLTSSLIIYILGYVCVCFNMYIYNLQNTVFLESLQCVARELSHICCLCQVNRARLEDNSCSFHHRIRIIIRNSWIWIKLQGFQFMKVENFCAVLFSRNC